MLIDDCVGEVLRGFRLKENMSYEMLSDAVSLSRQQTSNYLNGHSALTFQLMLRFCVALEVSAETFTDAVLKKYRKALKQSIKEKGQ